MRPYRRSAALQLLTIVGVLSVLRLVAAADVSIAPSVASLFVGEEKTVEGVVATAARDGNTVRLRLGTPPQDVSVSLVIGLLSNFPADPEHYYTGKTIRVTGTIRSFRGAAEIVVHDPAVLQVVGVAPPAAMPPAAVERPAGRSGGVMAEASLQQRLDALGERVRQLEERVQQLERPVPPGADH
jgi:hypothetical protein